MDTDNLTPMAYETLSLAYEACDPLRAEIGARATLYKTEDEFLRSTAKLIEDILLEPEDYLDSWNLLDEAELTPFIQGLQRVRDHIATTLNTPYRKRGKPPF